MNFASGATAAVGLMATTDGPPLSPATIGRPPAITDAGATVPLRSSESILAERSGEGATGEAPVPAPETVEMPPAAPAETPSPAAAETRRVVLRLVGGERLELGSYDGRDAALGAAQELIAAFTAAEAEGVWPELDGRFVRPASVVSIDVLVET